MGAWIRTFEKALDRFEKVPSCAAEYLLCPFPNARFFWAEAYHEGLRDLELAFLEVRECTLHCLSGTVPCSDHSRGDLEEGAFRTEPLSSRVKRFCVSCFGAERMGKERQSLLKQITPAIFSQT